MGRWLAAGKEYDVLCVYFDKVQGVLLRIIGEDGMTPALFPGELFEFIDSGIPRNWRIIKDQAGTVRLSPSPWLERGFWEKFFDHDPEAMIIFEHERELIEDPKPPI